MGLTLVNISRSQPMYDTHSLVIDIHTRTDTIDELWTRLVAALKTMPNDFNTAKSGLGLQNISQQTGMQLDFFIAHCTNWSKAQQIARRHFVIGTLRDLSLELEITFHKPPQPFVNLPTGAAPFPAAKLIHPTDDSIP
jgi:hypothetical protein